MEDLIMAQRKIVWSYNGISVSRRWLEFNYGKAWVNASALQADAYFRKTNQIALDFGNGIVAVSTRRTSV